MSLTKTKMDQDDLEEEFFYNSICGHLQLLFGLLQSSPLCRSTIALLWRVETLIFFLSLLAILVSIARFDKQGRFIGWVKGLTSCTLVNSFYLDCSHSKTGEAEWSEIHPPTTSIYSLQGRRSNNEDRAVFRKISVTGCEEVLLWAVMDGHGGEFSVNYCESNLIPSLTKALTQLKLLTSRLNKEEKLAKFEEMYDKAPSCVMQYIGLNAEKEKDDSPEGSESNKGSREQSEESPETKPKSVHRSQVVLSQRKKSLEEIPGYTSTPKVKRKETSEASKEKELSNCHELQLAPTSSTKTNRRVKTKSESGNSQTVGHNNNNNNNNNSNNSNQPQITDYIDSNGDILYAQLIKDEILKCDLALLKAAKAAGSIGGTTLLVSILDGAML